MGTFHRRAGNPLLLPAQTSSDGKVDLAIADPDVHWDASAARYVLYYQTPRGMAFGDPMAAPAFRRATSPDRTAWAVDDAPVFARGDAGAWDERDIAAPTVVINPAAPADRRYLMLYAGAARAFPFASHAGPAYAIGAAFSADGVTFTRATTQPVLTGAQVYSTATAAIVADPELALVDGIYHLWFSSFACSGASCETVTDRGIGHATSADGTTWTVQQSPVRSLLRASADDTTGGTHPSVVYDATYCRYEMWLANDLPGENDNQPTELANAAGIWHAESRDGSTWSIAYDRARDLVWNEAMPDAGEGLGLRAGADVAANGGRLMVYVGYDDDNVPAGYTLPDRSQAGARPGVMTLDVATRDLP